MRKNQHRWKAWIEDRSVAELLDGLAEALKWSWKLDQETPENFPLNTWWLFVQIEDQLKSKPVLLTGSKTISPPRTPTKVSDLIPESTIKATYEDHNEGSYEEALKLAAKGYDEGYAVWRKIMRALDVAYTICHYGIDFAPMPRVQFLHRRLLEIADSEYLLGLTLEGMVEFFDDVCPCGKNHQPDALRKLRKRKSNANSGHNETA